VVSGHCLASTYNVDYGVCISLTLLQTLSTGISLYSVKSGESVHCICFGSSTSVPHYRSQAVRHLVFLLSPITDRCLFIVSAFQVMSMLS